MRIIAVKRLNVLAAGASGAALALFPEATSRWIGTVPPDVLRAIGIVTLLYGAHVLASSLRTREVRGELLWFAACDAGWVVVTAAAILIGAISTAWGAVAAIALAAVVATFGVFYRREARRTAHA